MKKLFKMIIAVCLILALGLTVLGLTPAIDHKQEALQKAAAGLGYTREEVKSALLDYERSGNKNSIAMEVLLPASLDIKVPNLNESKVLNETPLSQYGNRHEFYTALRAHGYDDADMENMPYWQFEQLKANWLLNSATAAELVAANPELADRDVSGWTYGDYDRFNEQKSTEQLAARFMPEQLEALEARGITVGDTQPLFRTFFTAEEILAQSDDTLKGIIEDWYETKLTLSLGADWRLSARTV